MLLIQSFDSHRHTTLFDDSCVNSFMFYFCNRSILMTDYNSKIIMKKKIYEIRAFPSFTNVHENGCLTVTKEMKKKHQWIPWNFFRIFRACSYFYHRCLSLLIFQFMQNFNSSIIHALIWPDRQLASQPASQKKEEEEEKR